MERAVMLRVIANEQKRHEFFQRLELFCKKHDLRYKVSQDEPYWKIENLFEIGIDFDSSPVWNYGNWSAAFHYLFEAQFTIEWPDDAWIHLCHYPAYDDFDSYFVIFYIPIKYFVPQPSKSIRH